MGISTEAAQNLKADITAKLGVFAQAETDLRNAIASAEEAGMQVVHGLGDEAAAAARATAKFFVELV